MAATMQSLRAEQGFDQEKRDDIVAPRAVDEEANEKHLGSVKHEVGLDLYQEAYGLDTSGPEAKIVYVWPTQFYEGR